MKIKFTIALISIFIFAIALVGCSEASSISFDKNTYTVGIGKEITPIVSVRPKSIDYQLKVGNATIAKVDGKKLIGLKSGITKITAISGDKSAISELIVSDITSPNGTNYTIKDTCYATFYLTNYSLVGLTSGLLETQTYAEGDTVYGTLPAYTGYVVNGWFTDADCTIPFNRFNSPIDSNLKLYCKATMLDNAFLLDGNQMLSGLQFSNLPHDNLFLPKTLKGVTVKGIASKAFAGDTLLTSVTIPSTYESIGDYAFAGCTSLTKVEIEDNSILKSIGQFAFGVTAKNSETEEDTLVSGNDACKKLKSINLPDTISSIGAFAFGQCSSLELSKIPSSLTKIEYGAFYMTLIQDVDFTNITEIKAFAFKDCSKLITVRNTGKVEYCAKGAFEGSAFYKAQLNTAPYVVYAGTIAVSCSSSLGRGFAGNGKITLPDTLTLIADGAFNGKNQAELTVFFPKGEIKISDEEAFLDEEGVCLVVPENTLDKYIIDNPLYKDHFCIKYEILINEDANAINFGKHTLLKFPDGSYYYDQFTVITLPDDDNKLKSPKIISLQDLSVADNITRINTRAINLGEGGGNLETLIMPKNLSSVAILSVINCKKLTKIDFTPCFGIPTIVTNSFQFTSLNSEARIYVESADYIAYKNHWEACGVAYEKIISE